MTMDPRIRKVLTWAADVDCIRGVNLGELCKPEAPCAACMAMTLLEEAGFAQKDEKGNVLLPGGCAICGCTQENACPNGCSWTDGPMQDICTACALEPSPSLIVPG